MQRTRIRLNATGVMPAENQASAVCQRQEQRVSFHAGKNNHYISAAGGRNRLKHFFRQHWNLQPLNLAGLALIAALIGSYTLLSLSIAYDLPQADYWDWLHKLLIPYADGELSFSAYVTGAFLPLEHSHIPTLLMLYLNYEWFDLRFYLECFLGLICTLLICYFLVSRFMDNNTTAADTGYSMIALIALVAICLNPFNIHTLPLVQFEYFYILLAIVYLLIYDDLLQNRKDPAFFLIATLFMFFFGDAQGVVAILAVAAHLLVLSGLPARERLTLLAGMMAIIAISTGLASLAFTYVGMERMGKTEALGRVFSDLTGAVQFVLYGYSQTFIDQHSVIRRIFGTTMYPLGLLIGLVTLLINVAAFALFFARRKYFTSVLPVLLIMYSAIVLTGLLLSRFPLEGATYSLNDRYQRLIMLSGFGSYWIFATVFFASSPGQAPAFSPARQRLGRQLLVGFSAAVLIVSFGSSLLRWTTIDRERMRMETMAGGIIAHTQDPEIDLYKFVYIRHCDAPDDDCPGAVRFLKDNQLSIFRSGHVINQSDGEPIDFRSIDSFFGPR